MAASQDSLTQLSDGKTSLDNYATLIKTLNASGDAQKQGIASKLLTSGLSRAEIDAYGLTNYFPVDKYKDGVASYMGFGLLLIQQVHLQQLIHYLVQLNQV